MLADLAKDNPFFALIFKFIAQVVLHTNPEEFGRPESQSTGTHQVIRHYESATGVELSAREAAIGAKMPNADGATKVAALAESMVGIRGSDDVVRHFCNGQNVYWCAGFAKHMFDAAMPGVYDGVNLGAISFKNVAGDAFHAKKDGYTPHVGDALVFSRVGGNHVGVVTKVENGMVTYVSGNDGMAVRETTFPVDKPPGALMGYTDSHALAHKRGLDREMATNAPETPTHVAQAPVPQNQTSLRVAASR
jgi:hypothetical protein